jgi:hypothetical protein
MKWLVGLLVLVNVGLLVYFNLDKIVPPVVVKTELLNPEKLTILTPEALAAMPKKEAPPPEPAPEAVVEAPKDLSCYKWGSFTPTNLPSAQVVLVKFGLQSVVSPVAVPQEDRRFWVYYPPLKTADLAQKKADEIRALGVSELFIVQDSQWRNAISFGLFQDEQLASTLLTDLQAKGVKGATKALRNVGKGLSNILIKGVSAETALELQKVKPEFVGTELEPAACQ